jgi:hypothetical protein
MTDPSIAIRKAIEAKSPEVTDLITKHKDNATVASIGQHLQDLYDYSAVLEAQAGIYRAKHDHYHTESKTYANADLNIRPQIDNSQQAIINNEYLHPRENILYRVSTRYTINSAQIGCIDATNNKILLAGQWLPMKPWEIKRLTQLINSDNR